MLYRESCSHYFFVTGRSDCPSSWIKEYSGFVMGPTDQYRECVDKSMETVPSSSSDKIET